MNNSKDILQKYAKELGYKYALPIADGEFQNYYLCYNDKAMNYLKTYGIEWIRKAKLGSSTVISINKDTGHPYILDRSEFIQMNNRFIASGKELHSHLRPEDYQYE